MRIPYGGGIHAPEHHSECVEAFFAHIPGLRVVIPSSPRKAYGLLLAAIRDPDPVIFLEPKRLYRALQEDVRDDGRAVPLDHSFTLREGRDVTIVAWGSTIPDVLAAADGLRAENIHADVIDLATLSPLDPTTILHSVEKTGRCVIVEEASLTAGFGAEIAARIAEHALLSLLAPVRRVAAFDCVVPLAKLEAHYLPSVSRITAAAKDVMSYR
jgi:pyruvate dehydrogenase E1 component beta subunit